ncbi:acyl-CoA dehydrogenase family protein [Bordetella genomosp. 5]|uniref:Dibenzothiophene monooxygenase n=1 Tax=Bordetella genomosp. 5 TaxID=1395608 RepID=A0A261TQE6_9BORD|nr:acyl-CoA dehydrogenase family protein [Bordetella genomosp. 5]OZI51856.1 acyl-CoA dehydrogenase [Bordetella genomosp. 5]
MSHDAPTDQELAERFRPVFARIAEGAAQRDLDRQLAHEPVRWLAEAGFGALRVPREFGGLGASVEQHYDLLIELGEADSNLPQALRSHFGFIERLYAEVDPALHEPWLRRIADGAIFGNATTERGDHPLGELDTVLRETPDGWRLTGEKFYSTGTLYADWIQVSARREGRAAAPEGHQTFVLVPATAEGVTREDDWTGFGQRLSASGTTRFDAVAVDPAHILSYSRQGPTPMTAVFQLTHLATLAGIARAIVRETAAFVRPRKRTFSHGAGQAPAEDPLVQQVVGQLSATAFTATAAVRAVARTLGAADRVRQREGRLPPALLVQAELETAQAQVGLIDSVLGAGSRLFDVGGASALLESRGLDRHWRNARTLASHNPTPYKARLLGDHAINGTGPSFYWTVGARAA